MWDGRQKQVQVFKKEKVALKEKRKIWYIQRCDVHVRIDKNLISLGQLIKKRFYAIFDDHKCLVYNKRNKELIISATMTNNGMFQITFSKPIMNTSNIQLCNFTCVYYMNSPCFENTGTKKYVKISFGVIGARMLWVCTR